MDLNLRFSFVIPAHNEKGYIEGTLAHIEALSYPKDSYETIVVENASTDGTLEAAQKFAAANIKILHSDKKGSAAAKNIGIEYVSPHSDWVIFLDADTILEKEFLNELNSYLGKRPGRFSVGTVSLMPFPKTPESLFWFNVHNIGHWLTRSSYSIKVVRRSLFPSVHFDEKLTIGEDLHVMRQAMKQGGFFFMQTRSVSTSTRRFEQEGWWRILFRWTFVGLLPPKLQQRFTYKIVR